MARNKSFSAAAMADGNVPDGTDIRQRTFNADFVKSKIEAYAAWIAFDADNAQWRTDNPGQNDPTETHAAAVDPENPKVKESLFVEVRMQTVDATTGEKMEVNSPWRQVSTANYPNLNAGTYLQALKHIYDTEVTRAGLDPV